MKVLRWVGRILLALLGLLLIAVAGVYLVSNARLNKTYTIPQASLALTIPSDPARIERGKHLSAAIAKCETCHADNLAGGKMNLDLPPFRIVGPNLTRGQGGIAGQYSDADWVRAIRHGVSKDGRPLLVMPSQVFNSLSDADLADIIAYVKSVPAVDNQLPSSELKLLGRALLVGGQLPPLPAEVIDHTAPPPAAVPAGVSVEYGRYLATTAACFDCHGPGLSGGPIPGLPPGSPEARNITPTGIGSWSEADFFRSLREGKRPDGSAIDLLMPWDATRLMTDDEIKALFMYLKTVPPKPTGNR
jgi:mono/diheme cytochrome c family protein